ncbi:hypothetical protein [Catellatospora sichuanensis]|uniref:hypothetical protein n=1 Tax=Catellatospora sichuanensis TaxID=1969805 RepID=UPI001182D46B|nr:hypothetical protein [Catellatospora sichuanensis]
MRRLSTARPGRTARVLLLLATLVGLAAMHTLGHGGAAHAAMTPMPGHGTAPAAEGTAAGMTATVAAMAAHVEAVPQEGCPDGHCARLLVPPGRHTAGMDWWDLCVAVLTALGVLLLLFWLLGVVSRRHPAGPSRARAGAASRGPPVRGLGLTLATVSVMRH